MREMKGSGIAWIGEIPDDWRIIRNKNAFTCSKELVGEKSELTQLLSLTTRGIKKKDINNAEGKLPESFDTYQFVKENDLVMCLFDLDCSAVFSGISPYNGMISPAYRVLSCKKCMEPKYADYWFQYISDGRKFNHYAKNIRYTLSYEEFSALPLLLPERNEQRRIADYLDRKCSQIDAIIARQQEVIEKLKAYKLSVITEAVTKGLNPDVPMKDSGVEWIGEIPEHWEIRRIGSFARVTSSKRIFEESYVDEGVPFYRSKEITDLSKGLHVQTEIFIPEEVFEQVNEASPAPKCGDILLTSIGTIGNTWISDGRKFYYKDGNITQIEANDSFDSAYVEYCFSSNVVLEQYTRLAMGSTLLALTIIKIKKILVAFPPLDEQRKIVQYLKLKCSSIDAAIKNKENLITKLVDYKKSLIYEVVTGKKEV